jgi:pimeloyl-ACP methyl ester carboxylesterase
LSALRKPSRRTRIRLASLVAAGASLAAVAGVSAANAAPKSASSVKASSHAKPTIVFVHGAWADSNGWDSEITTLTRAGYPVVTVANPLRGVTSDADYVRDRLKTISGPIVLVGHSYGGAVITNAAVGVSNVKQLVYVAAFAPKAGESLATILPADTYPGSHLDLTKLDQVPITNPAAGGADADFYIKPADFADIFAGDVSPTEAALEAATQRPLSAFAYTQPSGPPAWKTIPSWDLVTLNDHAISPAGQKFMAARMHAHTETVASSHDVMISHPAAVDKIVEQAAAACS